MHALCGLLLVVTASKRTITARPALLHDSLIPEPWQLPVLWFTALVTVLKRIKHWQGQAVPASSIWMLFVYTELLC